MNTALVPYEEEEGASFLPSFFFDFLPFDDKVANNTSTHRKHERNSIVKEGEEVADPSCENTLPNMYCTLYCIFVHTGTNLCYEKY